MGVARCSTRTLAGTQTVQRRRLTVSVGLEVDHKFSDHHDEESWLLALSYLTQITSAATSASANFRSRQRQGRTRRVEVSPTWTQNGLPLYV